MSHSPGITPGAFSLFFLAMSLFSPNEDLRGRDASPLRFKRIQLSSEYHGEGAGLGDFNRDGVADVVSGPYWYEGPGFQRRHAYYEPREHPEEGGYAPQFFFYSQDFNADGWDDILTLPFPGRDAIWYENPRGEEGLWKQHLAMRGVDNESPDFGDLDGDGRREIICTNGGKLCIAKPDARDPTAPWTVTPLSEKGPWQQYTHGLGFGDLNSDGRKDLILREGWWEHPAPSAAQENAPWKKHDANFGDGGAQMYAHDVDGDGDSDVITSLQAHGWGLAWFENDGGRFTERLILQKGGKPDEHGVKFSQLHAVALADINGDGLRDIVTGKCRYAHGPGGDPEPKAPPVLYWFELRRSEQGVKWIPHLIDDDSGVGRQVTVGDLDADGLADIVIGNKRGTFVFLQERSRATEIVVSPGLQAAGLQESDLLLGELNCVACHEADSALGAHLLVKESPLLGEVGSRITPRHLRAFLADPQATKPGTPMPDLLHGLDASTRAETVEDLVHFLSSLRAERGPASVEADGYLIESGRKLYHQVGCVACHEPQEPPSVAIVPAVASSGVSGALREALQARRKERFGDGDSSISIPLGELARKTTVGELARFLRDPVRVRPSGRMPSLNLSELESRALAMYLLRDQAAAEGGKEPEKVAGIKYHYIELERGLDSAKPLLNAEPKSSGSLPGFDIGKRDRSEYFGFRFNGLIRIPESGEYTFFTRSDDGSLLYIGDRLVVDNDGTHSTREAGGKITLDAGDHPITVVYYENGGEERLEVLYEGPGIGKRTIPTEALLHLGRAMAPPGGEPFELDSARAERGRKHFATLGCASCHRLDGKARDIAPELAARPLASLRSGGCLAEEVPAGLPRFALSSARRRALASALAGLGSGGGVAAGIGAKEKLRRTMAALNCYGCHQRDGVGGVPPERQDYFVAAVEADLGDEGRFPPGLDGVGAKLTPAGLEKTLIGAGRARPYMATRMPQFGVERVRGLPSAFAALDLTEPEKPYPEVPPSFVKHGRELVGTKGLSCIVCHTYGKYGSLGIPATDLSEMTDRLRREWFFEYLLDPAAYKPGTRMPQFWPEGKAVRQDLLGGNTEEQLLAIYAFLLKGQSSRPPFGLKREGQELFPEDDRAIIYRHWIQGAGSRAIAVGYPEELNLAFDGDEMRLALLWKGSFLDASSHRNGRGAGQGRPLGEEVLSLTGGPPLAFLENVESPWPGQTGREAGYTLGGYRLDERRRPTFLYRYGEVRVEDTPLPVEELGKSYVVRQLSFRASSPERPLWFRVAAGKQIDAEGEGAFRIDDRWTVRLRASGEARPLLRKSQGVSELLVPVVFEESRASIREEIAW